jgi:hypothetical protein
LNTCAHLFNMVATIIWVRCIKILCVKYFKVNRGGLIILCVKYYKVNRRGLIILFFELGRSVGGVNA